MDFNERNAADLLAPLLEATPAPPRVDLDEADALGVPEHDRVAVDDVVDAVGDELA